MTEYDCKELWNSMTASGGAISVSVPSGTQVYFSPVVESSTEEGIIRVYGLYDANDEGVVICGAEYSRHVQCEINGSTVDVAKTFYHRRGSGTEMTIIGSTTFKLVQSVYYSDGTGWVYDPSYYSMTVTVTAAPTPADYDHYVTVHFCRADNDCSESGSEMTSVKDFELAKDQFKTPYSPKQYATYTYHCTLIDGATGLTIHYDGNPNQTVTGKYLYKMDYDNVPLLNSRDLVDYGPSNTESGRKELEFRDIYAWAPVSTEDTVYEYNSFFTTECDSKYKSSNLLTGDSTTTWSDRGWAAVKNTDGTWYAITRDRGYAIFCDIASLSATSSGKIDVNYTWSEQWNVYERPWYVMKLVPIQRTYNQALVMYQGSSYYWHTPSIGSSEGHLMDTVYEVALNHELFTYDDSTGTGRYVLDIYLFPVWIHTSTWGGVYPPIAGSARQRFMSFDQSEYRDATYNSESGAAGAYGAQIDIKDSDNWVDEAEIPGPVTPTTYNIVYQDVYNITEESNTDSEGNVTTTYNVEYQEHSLSMSAAEESIPWQAVFQSTISYDFKDELDDAAFTVLLDPNGGTFYTNTVGSEIVTEYYSTPSEEESSPLTWSKTVTLPSVHPPGYVDASNPGPMELYGWRTTPEYHFMNASTTSVLVELERYNRDTVLTRRIFPEWKPRNTERAKAYLSSQADVRSDNVQIPYLDLGFVQSINETYTASLWVTPVMTYDSRSSFAFDTGVSKTMSLTVKRTQINTPQDSSADSSLWSNTKWIHALRSFVDRWQMGTDGCQFFLSIPSDDNYLYTEYGSADGGVNCYLGTMTYNYSNDLPNGIEATIPITFGTMHPKKEKAASNQMTFEVSNATYGLEESYGIDALEENVDFKVPNYLWGGLPGIFEIEESGTKKNKWVSFKHWECIYGGETHTYAAGEIISAGDEALQGARTFTAVLEAEDVSNVAAVICNDPTKTYVDITNNSGDAATVTVFIHGGGGGGAGAGGGSQNDNVAERHWYGFGGNGGASGDYADPFNLTIPANTTIRCSVTIGAGGAGGAYHIGTSGEDGGDGGHGGETIFVTPSQVTYIASGGSGGWCRNKMSGAFVYSRTDAVDGYNAGGYGGNNDETGVIFERETCYDSSTSTYWYRRQVDSRQGSCGEDKDFTTEGDLNTISGLKCGLAGMSRSKYDDSTEQDRIRLIPNDVTDANGNKRRYWFPSFRYETSQYPQTSNPDYYYFPGTWGTGWTFNGYKFYSNGGGGGAPHIPKEIATWMSGQSPAIYPTGGNGGGNADYSGKSGWSGPNPTRTDPSTGYYGGGGGGGGYMFNESDYTYGSGGAAGGNGFIFIQGMLGNSGSIVFGPTSSTS